MTNEPMPTLAGDTNTAGVAAKPGVYEGRFCAGEGDLFVEAGEVAAKNDTVLKPRLIVMKAFQAEGNSKP